MTHTHTHAHTHTHSHTHTHTHMYTHTHTCTHTHTHTYRSQFLQSLQGVIFDVAHSLIDQLHDEGVGGLLPLRLLWHRGLGTDAGGVGGTGRGLGTYAGGVNAGGHPQGGLEMIVGRSEREGRRSGRGGRVGEVFV